MVGVREERGDSEGEEDFPADTDKSSTGSASSDGSDTEESEMDVEECERRRFQCINDMTDLERQFIVLRDQLFKERMTQIEAKLEEVKSGQAVEYTQPLKELYESMQIRIEVAAVLKQYRVSNMSNKYEAEKLACNQNFENEKVLLFDAIRDDLNEKIRRLEEDRNNIDISSDLWVEESLKKPRRKAGSIFSERRRKPVTVSGPYVVYMLKESDILEDWTVIKKALAQKKRSKCKPSL